MVVGRNGSGKSNFFSAIRFVLGDAFTNLSREDRAALLHEGSGSAVMSAYVELVLDNSDGRIPNYGEEVVIRRTVGLKKDDFSIDKIHVNKKDVFNLLESAGFSRNNPYYIVPQGKITALTNAKDSQRLDLLRSVAGTQTYEDRRQQSLEKMTETRFKQKKIDENLQYIEDRLNELEQEKQELKEFQERDREKRSIDYTIYENEIAELDSKIEAYEDQRQELLDSGSDYSEHQSSLEEGAKALESKLAELKERDQIMRYEKDQLEKDAEVLANELATLEVRMAELDANQAQFSESKQQLTDDIASTNEKITYAQQKLEQLLPEYAQLKTQEESLRNEVASRETRQKHLNMKQGRSAQFKSPREYGQWLDNEIAQLSAAINTLQPSARETESQIEDLRQQLTEKEKLVHELRVKLESTSEEYKEAKQHQLTLQTSKSALNDERKSLWREESRLTIHIDNLREANRKATHRLAETMSKDISNGLLAMEKIVSRDNISGVYGPLGDLISFDAKYKLAVEVTAGNSLFHVVVDTDETATRIMKELNRERSGRVTFMPLNRLRPPRVDYPTEDDQAFPLISKISHEPTFAPAVQQVFGKTLLCMNLDAGRQLAHAWKLNAITLAGDRIDSRGVLEGGHHDTRKSRIDAMRGLRKVKGDLDQKLRELSVLKESISTKSQEIVKAMNDENNASSRREALSTSMETLGQDIKNNTQEQIQIRDLISSLEQTLEGKHADIQSLEEQKSSFERDKQAGLTTTLSQEETTELESIQSELPELKRRYNEVVAQRTDVEQSKTLLEMDLNETLYSERDRLMARAIELENDSNNDSQHQEFEAKIKSLRSSEKSAKAKISQAESELDQIISQTTQLEEELASVSSEREKVDESVRRRLNEANNILNRQRDLITRKQQYVKKIRDLGALAMTQYDKFKNMPTSRLLKRSSELAEALKKFAHVNKKALEQHTNFTKQREDLLERRKELDRAEESIQELIETLDRRKDEAIDRTFKQVAKGFSEVFQKLVPAGVGRLIMQRRGDQGEQGDEELPPTNGGANADEQSVNDYVGVSISVSFNSRNDEQQRIEQLSGGQKSLCALALIFAIQLSDPAPFYLFDEIDANLDTQYRTAVADMVSELSQEGQFICTTFRPEMLQVADKFYGVLFNNKMSSIQTITQDDALTFIDGVAQGR